MELRGAGRDTRQVHNFGTPDTLDAASFIVCEVITPAGNWSSHPAHKHDEHVPGHESRLEEIYYFEAAVSREILSRDLASRDLPGGPSTWRYRQRSTRWLSKSGPQGRSGRLPVHNKRRFLSSGRFLGHIRFLAAGACTPNNCARPCTLPGGAFPRPSSSP